jgi:hypothetical protein
MAWPRNGLVILNDTSPPAVGTCLVPEPSNSCNTITGDGGGGGTGAGGLDNTVVASTLYANTNVGYFKINLEKTKTNMYGEALEKWYYAGVNVRCTLERGKIENGDDEFGVNVSNILTVNIPRALLQSYNFLPEVGDILTDREKYYEVNSIDTQFVTLPGNGSGVSNGSLGTTGQTITYSLSCYLTRITKLNIIPYYQ